MAIFLVVGIFVQFSMRPIIEWQMFTNWNLAAIGLYYLTVTIYSFTETGRKYIFIMLMLLVVHHQ
jgi:hypothetical protein